MLIRSNSTMLFFAALFLPLALAADETESFRTSSTSQLIEQRSDGTYIVSDDLDQLGDAAVPVILRTLEQARGGPPWHEVPMLRALMRSNSAIAKRAALEHVEMVWGEDNRHTLSHHEVIQEIRKQKLQSACGFLVKVMNAAWPELRLLVEKDTRVRTGSEYDQYVLSPAVLAADAIAEVCTGEERRQALEFLTACVEPLPPGSDNASQKNLSGALAPLVNQSAVAERYIVEEIEICFYPMSEMFERLPRDTRSVPLLRAIYEKLNKEPGVIDALTISAELAMFEALNEMEMSASTVPNDFWQKYWTPRKRGYLEYIAEQESMGTRESEELAARLKKIVDRRGLDG